MWTMTGPIIVPPTWLPGVAEITGDIMPEPGEGLQGGGGSEPHDETK